MPLLRILRRLLTSLSGPTSRTHTHARATGSSLSRYVVVSVCLFMCPHVRVSVQGSGQPPDRMDTTAVNAVIGQTASLLLPFRNPFARPITVSVTLIPGDDSDAFQARVLCLRLPQQTQLTICHTVFLSVSVCVCLCVCIATEATSECIGATVQCAAGAVYLCAQINDRVQRDSRGRGRGNADMEISHSRTCLRYIVSFCALLCRFSLCLCDINELNAYIFILLFII